jgi:uncharacterized protein
MSSVGYHEPIEELSDETRDMHRAIVSLMEELEAVDWYNQRAGACKDMELKAILAHNRDEEKEHASMVLEWIRRKDPQVFQRTEGLFVHQKAYCPSVRMLNPFAAVDDLRCPPNANGNRMLGFGQVIA